MEMKEMELTKMNNNKKMANNKIKVIYYFQN